MVYRCEAHPSMGVEWIAAKVYRPRQFRNLSNDAMYREGRHFLTLEEGRPQAVQGARRPNCQGGQEENGLRCSGKTHFLAYV